MIDEVRNAIQLLFEDLSDLLCDEILVEASLAWELRCCNKARYL